jgi:hypothetical protein
MTSLAAEVVAGQHDMMGVCCWPNAHVGCLDLPPYLVLLCEPPAYNVASDALSSPTLLAGWVSARWARNSP